MKRLLISVLAMVMCITMTATIIQDIAFADNEQQILEENEAGDIIPGEVNNDTVVCSASDRSFPDRGVVFSNGAQFLNNIINKRR